MAGRRAPATATSSPARLRAVLPPVAPAAPAEVEGAVAADHVIAAAMLLQRQGAAVRVCRLVCAAPPRAHACTIHVGPAIPRCQPSALLPTLPAPFPARAWMCALHCGQRLVLPASHSRSASGAARRNAASSSPHCRICRRAGAGGGKRAGAQQTYDARPGWVSKERLVKPQKPLTAGPPHLGARGGLVGLLAAGPAQQVPAGAALGIQACSCCCRGRRPRRLPSQVQHAATGGLGAAARRLGMLWQESLGQQRLEALQRARRQQAGGGRGRQRHAAAGLRADGAPGVACRQAAGGSMLASIRYTSGNQAEAGTPPAKGQPSRLTLVDACQQNAPPASVACHVAAGQPQRELPSRGLLVAHYALQRALC